MEICRDKLSAGLTYPIKPAVLGDVILECRLATPVRLFLHNTAFWRARPVFHAGFHPPGTVLNDCEVIWVGCRAVASSDCAAIRHWLTSDVIPEFIAWATEIEGLPANAPRRREPAQFVRDRTA